MSECPLQTKYGDRICIDGTLWDRTYSEMRPSDSRQHAGPCPYCNCKRCGGTGWLEPIGPKSDGSYITSRPCPGCGKSEEG